MNNTKNDVDITLEHAIYCIQQLDFTNIINKLINHMGWSKKHTIEASKMYRNFLFLQRKYGHLYTLPPSEDIDEFWHMHILDTEQYRKDCEAIFGRYLDHYPYLGIDKDSNFSDLEKAFTKLQELYGLEFHGEQILEVRGTWAKLIAFLKYLLAKKPKRHQLN
jgi:hypothetical protein